MPTRLRHCRCCRAPGASSASTCPSALRRPRSCLGCLCRAARWRSGHSHRSPSSSAGFTSVTSCGSLMRRSTGTTRRTFASLHSSLGHCGRLSHASARLPTASVRPSPLATLRSGRPRATQGMPSCTTPPRRPSSALEGPAAMEPLDPDLPARLWTLELRLVPRVPRSTMPGARRHCGCSMRTSTPFWHPGRESPSRSQHPMGPCPCR
mmetsp:Transcript_59804/g.192480  ORF Transcript_59804/g.192480 Transcript_59804/m.192480 type:complete len:208 (+) Transcript_59804:650-1273(+)